MEEIKVILVDEFDFETGLMYKIEAHQKGVLHRAVSVFIVNENDEWLLQQRALNKYHSAGLWTNTCCSHPLPGESNINAASRRLTEEMGLECELNYLFSFTYREIFANGLTEREFDHVFLGVCNQVPVINNCEVLDYKYINFDKLKTDIQENQENYTAWFLKICDRVNQHIIDFKKEKKD